MITSKDIFWGKMENNLLSDLLHFFMKAKETIVPKRALFTSPKLAIEIDVSTVTKCNACATKTSS